MPPTSTIALSSQLVTFLKVEAARRGVPMYVLAEDLIATGVGGRPWQNYAVRPKRTRRASGKRTKHR